MDLVTAVQSETTFDTEILRLTGGMRKHQATVRYKFNNVLATKRGCYILGKSFSQNKRITLKEILSEPLETSDKGLY